MSAETPHSLMLKPAYWPALGFGAGLAPHVPGSAGTLVGVAVYLVLQDVAPMYYVLLTVILCGYGIWVCGRAAEALGVPDHPAIVWDEAVGYLIAMTAAPSGWLWMLLGFLLFRIFDIWKPWPAGWSDRHIGGGVGIMADDVVAGVYAGIVIQVTSHLSGGWLW